MPGITLEAPENRTAIGAKSSESAKPVGAQAARGVVWTVGFSILNKVIAMGAQVAIAWFLSPKDIGLVATATSVVGILSILMGAQLQRVLIQRQRTFNDDAGQVFWLSLCMNIFVAALIAALASTLSRAFGDLRLKELLWIVAASIPIMAIPVAYGARLFIDLRFGLISLLSFGEGVIRNLGGALLAAVGFGPRSLVIPLFFSALFAAAAQRKAAGRVSFGRPEPSRWTPLLAPTFWLMLNASLTSGIGYGTNLIIAASHPLEVAGLYYWGFSMSAQAVFLLVTSLQGILFPAFAKMLDSSERQRSAFEQTTEILTMIVVPITCLQALLARPAVTLLFQPAWLPAVPVIQWLSAGMITQPLNVVGTAVLMARGEYKKLAAITSLMAGITLGAALVGSRLGQQKEIAQWVGMATLLTNLLPGWSAYHSLGGGIRRFVALLGVPTLIGIPAAAVGLLLEAQVSSVSPLPRIVLVSAAVFAVYVALSLRFCPQVAGQVLVRLRGLRTAPR
jgi:PST family polysaccharide transporter